MSEKCNLFPDPQFKGYEFSKADMRKVSFNGVDLSDSKFWAVLRNSTFSDCNMPSSKFDDVNLSGSTFKNINLSNTTFHDINLSGASFDYLNMSNVKINEANIEGMEIFGVLVTDLFGAYEKSNS